MREITKKTTEAVPRSISECVDRASELVDKYGTKRRVDIDFWGTALVGAASIPLVATKSLDIKVVEFPDGKGAIQFTTVSISLSLIDFEAVTPVSKSIVEEVILQTRVGDQEEVYFYFDRELGRQTNMPSEVIGHAGRLMNLA